MGFDTWQLQVISFFPSVHSFILNKVSSENGVMSMPLVSLNPFLPLPDCVNSVDNTNDPEAITCDDLCRKIVAMRVYLVLIILNSIFIITTTGYYIYRNISAKWAQTSEPTIHLTDHIILKQWQTYSLKKRGLFGTVLGAFGHLVFSTSVLLYQTVITSFTCEIYLWGLLIGFYIWMYAIVWRTLRLHLLFRLNQLQQRFTDRTIFEDKEYQWFMQHRQTATRSHLCMFLLSFTIIAIIIIISEVTSIRVHGPSRCQYYWGNYVVMGMVAFFFVIVVPFIIWYLRSDADTHGIRRELWVTVGVGIPCFIICIIWQVLFKYPTTSNPAGIRGLFGPSNWIIILTTTSHVMSVVLPLFKTLSIDNETRRASKSKAYRKPTATDDVYSSTSTIPSQKLELTTESLHHALADPHMLRVLQAWAVKDFSVENILFYDRYLHLLQGVQPNNNTLDTSLGADQIPEVVDFYYTFIAENAPLQVNISHKARSTIDAIMEPFVYRNHIKHATFKYDLPLPKSSKDPYMPFPLELISSTSPDSKPSKLFTESPLSLTSIGLVDTPTIALEVFEEARAEVFWNIFSGLFPKVVAASE
ncbi:hypothetical protein MAM1_0045c03124 [Mucor ambiguus]|uniref:RGS domain-containing protein n=1 Tax=Mucor ambiguus TaxID=91626 RepID=A0A0C9M917_9FUNG|nr:hypothetical protein MAM1_0045c03124 [Mucor ambiguus]